VRHAPDIPENKPTFFRTPEVSKGPVASGMDGVVPIVENGARQAVTPDITGGLQTTLRKIPWILMLV
jgi:hypothetical protein